MFPLLGIIFAFVVATNFAMSRGEEWSASYFAGVVFAHWMIGAAFARAGMIPFPY